MSISFAILIGGLVLITLICFILVLADWFGRPEHIGIGTGLHIPPVFSWINKPNPDWSEDKRTLTLQNGSIYVIPISKSGHFVMLYDWQVKFTLDGIEYILTIPSNATTDFASIPKILQSFISPLSNTVYAAILHDYLYRNPEDIKANSISRANADRIFYWSMLARGVGKRTAIGMYLGVKMFGSSSYKR